MFTVFFVSVPLGEVRDGVVRIGDASMSVCSHNAAAMVPDVLFYDNDLVRITAQNTLSSCQYLS